MVPKPKAPSGRASHPKGDKETPLPARLLPTILPKELFQGVPLHRCLSGFGKHWANSSGEQYADFFFSEEVEFLEDFLSHDWATSRWSKLCALLVVYNSKAACIAAGITTFVWSILGKALLMPDASREQTFLEYCVFVTPVIFVYYLFLVCWQQIRSFFVSPSMVFLDKLCISQHHMHKKEEGIAGLAAFLSNSKRMVILWSPKYFSRLWCTYELGAFLRLHRRKRVEIIPASFGACLCIGSVLLSGSFFVFTGIDAASFSYEEFSLELAHVIRQVMATVTVFLAVWVYMKTLGSLAQLSEQLSSFSIRDAECFCCSVGHRMPETGQQISCDRRVVYGTLSTWYSTEKGSKGTDPLELFDQEVRSHLNVFVAQQMGNGYFPITHFSCMLIVCRVCLSFSFYFKDVLSPATVWLEVEPEAASPFFRCSKMIEEPVNLSLGLFVVLVLARLSGRIALNLRNRCFTMLCYVALLVLIMEGVQQLNRALLLYLRYSLYSAADWAALAYQLVLTIFCVLGIRVLASRSKAGRHGATSSDH